LKSIVDLPEGVYNFGPLKNLVKETMTDARLAQLAASDVACILNAVNLQSGNLVLCTQDAHRRRIEKWFAERGDSQVEFLGYDRFRRAMRASSAVPAAVDPLEEDNVTTGAREQLVDGGVLEIAPLRAAIAAGATHVIAVLMSPRLSIADPKYRDNLLQVATRSVDLLTDEILRNDVETAELVTRLHELAILLAGSNVPLPAWLEKYRSRVPVELAIVEPPLPLGDTFDFDSDKREGWPDAPIDGTQVNIMRARMECGERTAKKAIAEQPELKAILERFGGT
jgi:predicted acylesterase/phospholipase RssA